MQYQQHYLFYSLLLVRMNSGVPYVADPLNTVVGEVAYSARHHVQYFAAPSPIL